MRFLTCLPLALLAASALFAQTTAVIAASPGAVSSTPVPVTVGVVGGFLGAGPTSNGVTNAPYSAEEVTERVQTLADGTHITQPAQHTKYYRASLGRTRVERSFPVPAGAVGKRPEGPSVIEINDPVAGVRYTLQPANHKANKMTFAPPPPPPPPPVQTGASAAARLGQATRSGAFAAATMPAVSDAPRPQFAREDLGQQTIEGVLATGTRTTTTYPIGAIGNDRPIVSNSENWVSPELKVTILSKMSDPRNGESTTRLTNISRAEPDASLFQVPTDYEIIEPQKAVGGINH
jgi:hypothetical protein